jgi:copper chaperone
LEKELDMNTYQFKTNIKCAGCVGQVTPVLNANDDVKKWDVDINNPSKILTVETESLDEDAVKQLVEKAGFKAEALN